MLQGLEAWLLDLDTLVSQKLDQNLSTQSKIDPSATSWE
jgi:hypothetical protein